LRFWKGFSVVECDRLTRCLLLGLDFLHSRCGLCHRDVKPANLLLSRRDALGWAEMKICDLGSAVVVAESGSDRPAASPYVCSRFYRSPELLLGCRRHGAAVDMWAAACVVAEMLSGRVLLPGTEDAMHQVV
jgi:serine/threonine protein kinase